MPLAANICSVLATQKILCCEEHKDPLNIFSALKKQSKVKEGDRKRHVYTVQ